MIQARGAVFGVGQRSMPSSHEADQQRLASAGPVSATGRRAAHLAIRGYQLSLSMLIGRQCRHWPSCSDYADEAIQRHGVWAGGWVGLARICRCTPFGTSGIDLVCEALPDKARWWRPWAYGRWRGVNAPPVEAAPPSTPEP